MNRCVSLLCALVLVSCGKAREPAPESPDSPQSGPRTLTIAVGSDVPYETVMRVIASASRESAGFTATEFLIAGSTKVGGLRQQQFDLRSRVAVIEENPPNAIERPLSLVVTITRDKLILWSLSGLEGTLKQPRVTLAPTDTKALTEALQDIVSRRWPDGNRDASSRDIVIMANSYVLMHSVLDIAAACRATSDGTELFPNIMFSVGFE